MKKYTVQNQDTGKKITFEWNGDEPPTDSDMEEVFAASEKTPPASGQPKLLPGEQAIKDFSGRLKRRSDSVYAPTTLGDMVKAKPGGVVDAIVGTPERALRLGLGAFGSAADAAMLPVSAGLDLANRATGGAAGRGIAKAVTATGAAKNLASMAGKYDELKKSLPAAAQANFTAMEGGLSGLAQFAGLKGVKAAPAATKKVVGATGEKLESAGKSIIASDAKIRDSVAKLAGETPLEGVKKITDDIAKYEVASVTGGFKGIAANAQKRIDSEMGKVDNAISDYATKNPKATVDVDNTFLNLADDMMNGKEKSIFLDEDKAAEIAFKIHSSLSRRGLTGAQPISRLPEIKRAIDDGMNLFAKGSKNIEVDPMPKKVGELAYLRLKNELEAVVPEVKNSNKVVHDLITVKTAMESAQKLAGNRNKLGITDLALIFGGPGLAHSVGLPAMAAGAPGVVLAGKKIAGDARGASVLIKTGKTLKDMAKRK